MRSDLQSPLSPLEVIGVPGTRRVDSFVAAARRAGRFVHVCPYLTALDPSWEGPRRGGLVRIESPGGCDQTLRAILALGVEPLAAAGGSPLSRREIADNRFERGELPPSRQWYFGFRSLLHRLGESARRRDAAWWSSPAAIAAAFDKAACLDLWTAAGLPVPPRYLSLGSYDAIRLRIPDRHARIFVKLRYGSSAAGAVALEWRGPLVRAITTVDVEWSGSRPRMFLSRKPRVLVSELEIARLVDALGREEIVVEDWLSKARWEGLPFDLRLLTVGGEVRHVVGRANASPFTNLNLDARRIDRASLERRFGPAWKDLESLAEAAAASLPGAFHLGIDVLVRPGLRRFSLLEANAFGDDLPNLLHRGRTVYEVELNAMAAMEPVCR